MENNQHPHMNGNGTEEKKRSSKSILKNDGHDDTKESKKRSRLVWDEANLIYNDANKSATMKIDEPKTPFHREYSSDFDEGIEGTTPPGGSLNWGELESAMSKAAQQRSDSFSSSSDRDSASEKDDGFSSGSEGHSEGGEGEHRSRVFESKRKFHYDEYQSLMQWRQRQKGEESDDDEEKEEKESMKRGSPGPSRSRSSLSVRFAERDGEGLSHPSQESGLPKESQKDADSRMETDE